MHLSDQAKIELQTGLLAGYVVVGFLFVSDLVQLAPLATSKALSTGHLGLRSISFDSPVLQANLLAGAAMGGHFRARLTGRSGFVPLRMGRAGSKRAKVQTAGTPDSSRLPVRLVSPEADRLSNWRGSFAIAARPRIGETLGTLGTVRAPVRYPMSP